MTSSLDMSLDDIIKKSKGSNFGKFRGRGKFQRGGGVQKRRPAPYNKSFNRRGGGYNNNYNSARYQPYSEGNVNSAWTHDLYDGEEFPRYGGYSSNERSFTELIVSNLEYSVSNSDIKELFAEFGDVISAEIEYDKSGRSVGVAHVLFRNKIDAVNAKSRYEGMSLDGRPMEITLISDGRGSGGGGGGFRKPRQWSPKNRGGFSNRRGRGNRGSFTRNRRGKPDISVADLDAELDEYRNSMK